MRNEKADRVDLDTASLGGDEAFRPRQLDLLSALEAGFFANGYRATTMNELAQTLKCSKRALYELAPCRKDLFVLVVERWARRVRRLGDQAANRESDPARRLEAFLAPGVTETAAMAEPFLADLFALAPARQCLERHQRERMLRLKALLDEGVGRGAFKHFDSHLVAGICLAGIEKINESAFLREAGLTFSEAFAQLYRLLMTGLERDAGCGSGDRS